MQLADDKLFFALDFQFLDGRPQNLALLFVLGAQQVEIGRLAFGHFAQLPVLFDVGAQVHHFILKGSEVAFLCLDFVVGSAGR